MQKVGVLCMHFVFLLYFSKKIEYTFFNYIYIFINIKHTNNFNFFNFVKTYVHMAIGQGILGTRVAPLRP